MFSEVLKIVPKVDSAALSSMENSLSKRFGRIAKTFAGGIKSALLGGGITATVVGIIDKLLNPLKEAKEQLDNVLKKSDDLVTFAKEFHSTTGRLFNLQSLAAAKGVDPDTLNTMLQKFQGAVSEAIKDPHKQTSVRAFAINGQDNVEAFVKYITEVAKLRVKNPAAADIAEQEIFGEKFINKSSEFVNANLDELAKRLHLPNAVAASNLIDHAGKLSDENSVFDTKRGIGKFLTQAGSLNDGTIVANQKNLIGQDKRDIERLSGFTALASIDTSVNKIVFAMEKGMIEFEKHLVTGLGNVEKMTWNLDTIMKVIAKAYGPSGSKAMRGVFQFGTPPGDK